MKKAMIALLLLCPAAAWVHHPVGRPQQRLQAKTELDSRKMSELMVREHEKTLEVLAAARGEVLAEFQPRIAQLEDAIRAARTAVVTKQQGVPATEQGAPSQGVPEQGVPATEQGAPSQGVPAPSQELHFLEYSEVPINVVSKKEPLAAKVVSVERVIGRDAPGEICEVVLSTRDGNLPYVEGQSLGVLPPGLDRKGRPHQQRLYSIASTRYGDDGGGTSVTLCVRRAVFTDPETGAEDPSKKGVCSNFLCDAKENDVVHVAGPTGKTMLLPENDDAADLIMVATGTGIAPFRAFVRRLFIERTPAAAAYEGRAWLFLGVPTTSSLLYSELWEAAKERGQFDYAYAISREQTNPFDPSQKCYVQHRLQQHADEIFSRLEAGAHIYFCGLKGMMPGIEATLADVCAARGLDFKAWVKGLKNDKRWHVEVY